MAYIMFFIQKPITFIFVVGSAVMAGSMRYFS